MPSLPSLLTGDSSARSGGRNSKGYRGSVSTAHDAELVTTASCRLATVLGRQFDDCHSQDYSLTYAIEEVLRQLEDLAELSDTLESRVCRGLSMVSLASAPLAPQTMLTEHIPLSRCRGEASARAAKFYLVSSPEWKGVIGVSQRCRPVLEWTVSRAGSWAAGAEARPLRFSPLESYGNGVDRTHPGRPKWQLSA